MTKAFNQAEIEALAEQFRVIGHPLRLSILYALDAGEASVGELASGTGITLSALSQQLATLRKAALVQTRREAKQIFYSLAPEGIARLQVALAALQKEMPATPPLVAASGPTPDMRLSAAMFARVEPRR